MHHFLYPTQDTFITNRAGLDNLNFGLNEILRVGTENVSSKIVSSTTPVPYSQSVSNFCLFNFSGSVLASSLYGTSSFAVGTIYNVVSSSLLTSNFSGLVTASFISASLTGSITGSVTGFTGSLSGSFSGSVSGSFQTDAAIFDGVVIGFTGKIINGTIVGTEFLNQQNTRIVTQLFADRALLQFDLSAISASISTGDIKSPHFTLIMKVARAEELPIQYNLYAFPISESWVMGDGYFFDGGSTKGASWDYRDKQNGIGWVTTGSTYIQSLSATQSFNYEVGDVSMDVTPIVMAWISQSVVNNGLVVLSSDEFNATGSGMTLYFFSRDTNTIYSPHLDAGWLDSSQVPGGFITGSITTGSITSSVITAGINGIVSSGGFINGLIHGDFTGIGNITVDATGSATGVVDLTGTSGLITSMSIFGSISGSVSSSIQFFNKQCSNCQPALNVNNTGPWWSGNGWTGWNGPGWNWNRSAVWDWNWVSMPQVGFFPCGCGGTAPLTINDPCFTLWQNQAFQLNQSTFEHAWWDTANSCSCSASCSGSMVPISLLSATLLDGPFSGSTFTSSFCSGYKLGYGLLVGPYSDAMISGSTITANYPFTQSYPSLMMVTFNSPYFNGDAFGSITNLSASYGLVDWGIFDGIFVTGPIAGDKIHAPFTGSILSASIFTTASVTISSNILGPLQPSAPFVITTKMPQKVKTNEIIRIKVFGREQYPLKNFQRLPQFSQFITPLYLPSSSYYSIKDNETEEIILDFDNYTQISCDPSGSYFLLDTSGLPQERYFKLIIKIVDGGLVYVIDNNDIFKVVR